ncbi:hypothetical protein [uncultured Kocuria sp.]|nr:hypothetical protein [uncultured Kocuria sp.]
MPPRAGRPDERRDRRDPEAAAQARRAAEVLVRAAMTAGGPAAQVTRAA